MELKTTWGRKKCIEPTESHLFKGFGYSVTLFLFLGRLEDSDAPEDSDDLLVRPAAPDNYE